MTAKLYARFFKIRQVRWVINDAIRKGFKISYLEEGGFFYTEFTLKGNKSDVRKLFNHIMKEGHKSNRI